MFSSLKQLTLVVGVLFLNAEAALICVRCLLSETTNNCIRYFNIVSVFLTASCVHVVSCIVVWELVSAFFAPTMFAVELFQHCLFGSSFEQSVLTLLFPLCFLLHCFNGVS